MLGETTIEVVHVESGIDYITMTMPAEDNYSSTWWNECSEYVEELASNGSTIKQASVLGYSGALVGNVFIGERADGIICRASGAAARGVYASLYNSQCRVSRLDLQTTVWTADRAFSVGKEAARAANEWNRHPSGAIKRRVLEYTGNDGGYTLYVGSRSSSSFLRLYDKNAQSKDERYTNAWRYEIQIQGTPAAKVAEALARSTTLLEQAVSATVCAYCEKRGVRPIYTACDAAIVVPAQEVPTTDVARMLMWLDKQVRPTVDRLKRMGYTDDVALLFGLSLPPFEADNAHD